MEKIIKRIRESRKDYLVRVAIAYIKLNPEGSIIYDDTECDGYYLAEDLEMELDYDIRD